jgi:phospholipase C
MTSGHGSSTLTDRRRGVGDLPIEHVVVIYQENHSFDNVLARFCVATGRCDGSLTGELSNGTTYTLTDASDIVPLVDHSPDAQQRAIDSGAMDHFDQLLGCTPQDGYPCYSAFQQAAIPNLWRLADAYAVSDRTFQMDTIPTWGAHMELVAATLDGFVGDNPEKAADHALGVGWGCDSYRVAQWADPVTDEISMQPSCIPDAEGNGPYRASPVSYVPTIMGRLDDAGLSWSIYATRNRPGAPKTKAIPYGWAICPTFAECIYGPQVANMVPSRRILTDAVAGTLPSLSIVLPSAGSSQHNSYSMLAGDNWIGRVVAAIQEGPDWSTTAIFITYDDCGCFYDHVAPPTGLGLRVPMVIVSPFAIHGTDSNVADFASILAFTEHTFGLAPLGPRDAAAYDYAASFNYVDPPRVSPVPMVITPIPWSSLAEMRSHPPDPSDPT